MTGDAERAQSVVLNVHISTMDRRASHLCQARLCNQMAAIQREMGVVRRLIDTMMMVEGQDDWEFHSTAAVSSLSGCTITRPEIDQSNLSVLNYP